MSWHFPLTLIGTGLKNEVIDITLSILSYFITGLISQTLSESPEVRENMNISLNRATYEQAGINGLPANYDFELSFILRGIYLGYLIFICSNVSTIIFAIAQLRNHFLFAGMIYQGAQRVLQRLSISP